MREVLGRSEYERRGRWDEKHCASWHFFLDGVVWDDT